MIENLKLITTENFDDIPCDFYKNINGEYFMTREQIGTALGYKHPRKAIETIHLRHKELLDKYCCKIKSEINHFPESCGVKSNGSIQERVYYSYEGIASIVKYSNASKNKKEKLIQALMELSNKQTVAIVDAPNEIKFLDKLEPYLEVFNITGTRQYKVLDYRIDFYIPTLNIAVEYDENNHKYYTYEQQELRQELIENALHCRFIRLSDKDTDEVNLAKVIKEIYDIKEF